MKKRIERNTENIDEFSIVIDSAMWSINELSNITRIDHHITNDWVNLDTVYKYFMNSIASHNYDLRNSQIITSYLDPDAIISASVLDSIINFGLNLGDFIPSVLGKILYSASFFCDYNTSCNYICPEYNSIGHRLESYLRFKMEIELGEDRTKLYNELVIKNQDTFFNKYSQCIMDMIRDGHLKNDILQFDDKYYLAEQSLHFKDCITKLSNDIGIIRISNSEKRIIPRAYYRYFDTQRIVVRIINDIKSAAEQIFIGVNPSINNWDRLDLLALSRDLLLLSSEFKFSGRKSIIGNDKPIADVENLITFLTKIKINNYLSDSNLFSIYKIE